MIFFPWRQGITSVEIHGWEMRLPEPCKKAYHAMIFRKIERSQERSQEMQRQSIRKALGEP